MVFRRYFRFPLPSSPWRLFGCLERSPTIYRPTFPSLSFSFPRPLFHRHRFVSFFSFRLIPAAFQHRGSSARTLLIASFLDEEWERAASFLAEEISGPDHAIDFHASLLSVFLLLFPTIPSFVASVGITGNLNWIFRASIGDASI